MFLVLYLSDLSTVGGKYPLAYAALFVFEPYNVLTVKAKKKLIVLFSSIIMLLNTFLKSQCFLPALLAY